MKTSTTKTMDNVKTTANKAGTTALNGLRYVAEKGLIATAFVMKDVAYYAEKASDASMNKAAHIHTIRKGEQSAMEMVERCDSLVSSREAKRAASKAARDERRALRAEIEAAYKAALSQI